MEERNKRRKALKQPLQLASQPVEINRSAVMAVAAGR
jgi:hypothetical protein